MPNNASSWLRRRDSNARPSGYEPDELPTAPPRYIFPSAEIAPGRLPRRSPLDDYIISQNFVQVCASFVNFHVKKEFLGKNHGFFYHSTTKHRNFIEASRYIPPKTKAQSHHEKA